MRLPDLGEGTVSAEVIAWKVAPGDVIREDAPLVEMSTEKAVVEVPSPVSGRVVAYITHPLLSGSAVEKISKSALDQLVVTDTIPLSTQAKECGRIRQLTVAGLLGETIRRIRDEESVSSLYVD